VARHEGRQVVGAQQGRHRDRDEHARTRAAPRRGRIARCVAGRRVRGAARTGQRARRQADERVGAALVQPPLLARRAVHRDGHGLHGGHDLGGVVGRQVGGQVGHGAVDRLDADEPLRAGGGAATLVGTVGIVHDLRPAHALLDLRDGEPLDLGQHLADGLAPPVLRQSARGHERLGLPLKRIPRAADTSGRDDGPPPQEGAARRVELGAPVTRRNVTPGA
jgi:hypothetical protein